LWIEPGQRYARGSVFLDRWYNPCKIDCAAY
jgi:hypothetical protein